MSTRKEKLAEKLALLQQYRDSLSAKKGMRDLYHFSREIIETDEKRKQNIVPHVHGEWAEWYHKSEKRLKMILVPRGTFKSTFFTVNNVLRKLAADRNERILIANAVLTNSQKFLGEIRNHMTENKNYISKYGEFYDKKLKWNENEIEIIGRAPGIREPSVAAAGVEGQLVSQHYSTIIWDDLVNEQNITTRDQANKVIDWWKRTMSLLDPDGEGIIVGTRWSHFELYQYILDELDERVDIFIRRAYNEDGSLYFPELLSDDKLKELRQIEGSYIFSAFYLNDPVDSETSLVQRDTIHTYGSVCHCGKNHKIPEVNELTFFTSCDPAVSQSSQADSSALVTVAVDSADNWWVVDCQSGKWTTNELIERLFLVHDKFSPQTMIIEVLGQAQALLTPIYNEEQTRKRYLPLRTIKTRAGNQKEARIRAVIEPRFTREKVFVHYSMEELMDQLVRYPRSKHDDILDAMTDIEEIYFKPDEKALENTEGKPLGRLQEHIDRLSKDEGKYLHVDPHMGFEI